MPSPPFQMRNISTQSPLGPKKRSGVVMMWYTRAPMMPAGTAHSVMSRIWSNVPPACLHRFVVIHTAHMMPARMHSA